MIAKAATLILLPLFFLMAGHAAADDLADFYRGKQLQMVVSTGAGTVFDSYARLLSKYLPKYVPGPPKPVVVLNMPGAGGIRAMNFMAKSAAHDGTVLAITNQGLPLYQALHLGDSLQVDLRDIAWIGNLSQSNQVLATWYKSPTKTLADAKQRETTVGIAGTGSITAQLPEVYNNVLHTKLKLVAGYQAGTDINLAMERGELEGRGSNTWASYVSLNPDWVRDKKLNVLVQVGVRKEASLPDVPLLTDEATNPEDRDVFAILSQVAVISRPIVTTPDVPADRVAALRKAFDSVVSDPEFLGEAQKARLEIDPTDGQALQKMIAGIVDAPAQIKEKVRLAIEPSASDAH